MKGFARVAMCVLILPASGIAFGQETGKPRTPTSDMANEVKGLKLFMFEYAPAREAQRPTFTVEADLGRRGEGAVWTLSGVRAVAHGNTTADNPGESMTIVADSCTFDEANQVARLSGNVTVEAGDTLLALDEVEWNNEAEEARTVGPVEVRRGEATTLRAEGLVLNPVEQRLLCRNAHGVITFAEESL